MLDARNDRHWMQMALSLARGGLGRVEPNPMVGCVIVADDSLIGSGFHQQLGGDHAEIMALTSCSKNPLAATAYVTLEPCCHHGKTPPCTDALIRAKVARVVIGAMDPSKKVSGNGIRRLRDAGIQVGVGICEDAARRLIAPFTMLQQLRRPWVIAKWAMTLDGKMSTGTDHSKWISSAQSRAVVHEIRGRVDGIMVGGVTAATDDPLLTARPPGPRIAHRIVASTNLDLSIESQLVQTAREIPFLIAVGPYADERKCEQFQAHGCEIQRTVGETHRQRLAELMDVLGKREITNLLVEGGPRLLGTFFDLDLIDEVHAFVAPSVIGGAGDSSPCSANIGREKVSDAMHLTAVTRQLLGGDYYIHGYTRR